MKKKRSRKEELRLRPLSPEETKARKPQPPEELVEALQDRIHFSRGKLLSAVRIKEEEKFVSSKLTPAQRLYLVRYWSDWFYDHTDTFKGSLGLSLAYLWPAIVNGNKIEVSEKSSIVKLLKVNGTPPESNIWQFIDIVG